MVRGSWFMVHGLILLPEELKISWREWKSSVRVHPHPRPSLISSVAFAVAAAAQKIGVNFRRILKISQKIDVNFLRILKMAKSAAAAHVSLPVLLRPGT